MGFDDVEWEEGKIVIAVLDSTGDTKRVWDKNNEDEVEDARASFDRLKKKGYVAFHVGKDGEKTEQMRTFDASAERVIMVPPLAGG